MIWNNDGVPMGMTDNGTLLNALSSSRFFFPLNEINRSVWPFSQGPRLVQRTARQRVNERWMLLSISFAPAKSEGLLPSRIY